MRLCEDAAGPAEHTYLAQGWRLRAEAALAQGRGKEAHDALARAVEIVEAVPVPLAAWRVHATAARWHQLRGHGRDSAAAQARAEVILHALALALSGDGPLSATFAAAHPRSTSFPI
jgi:hypothetical protein